jgi:hypothetical protein
VNREQHLKLANDAVTRAERLAGDAEKYASSSDRLHYAEPTAAVGSLWAEISRTHAAIAAAKPETAKPAEA